MIRRVALVESFAFHRGNHEIISCSVAEALARKSPVRGLSAISLANFTIHCVRGWAQDSSNTKARMRSQIEALESEVALQKEELRIKDIRSESTPPKHRARFAPQQRFEILKLKAVRGWSIAQTARVFQVSEATISSWQNRLDETGSAALVQMAEPINKFPELVWQMVRTLKSLCPALGKVKIAEILARVGLHLASSTVARMIKAKPKSSPANASKSRTDRIVAKRPNHVWHVDLTAMPIGGGLATTWSPFALIQRWPFCWWIACVIDHYSRKSMGVAIFHKQPKSKDVRKFLSQAMKNCGQRPKYIICDHGKQFWCNAFKNWAKRLVIKLRFGAIGKHGSIAIVERFILTFKNEFLRKTRLPYRHDQMQAICDSYILWYNQHRPHSSRKGKTPDEVYFKRSPANQKPRFEPRPNWPCDSPCAAPLVKIRGKPGVQLKLCIEYLHGLKQLPIIKLKRAG